MSASFTTLTPEGWAQPPTYSHGLSVPPGHTLVSVTGQVGVTPQGQLGESFERQAEIACANLGAVLAAGGMDFSHLVKTTVYLTRAEDIPAWRAVRLKALGPCAPTSTLLVVAALAHPDWRFEIDAFAAR